MKRSVGTKVLVTGHCGFIGRHLVDELAERRYVVSGIDLADEDRPLDLCDPHVIADELDRITPDVVVHLGAQVGRVFGERDVRHTVRANAEVTTQLAKACGERGVRVLYASSSEVYGDQGAHVCAENSRCLLPHNLYGLTKRWGEEALRLYAPAGLQIVRLSMPYGPGAPPGEGRRALDNVLWQAVHRKPIPIHRGAERSWCWIGDTVRAIRLVLERGEQGAPTSAIPDLGVYNIGRDDAPLSMHDLAIKCCDLAGAPRDLIELVPAPAAQTVVKRLSTNKLRSQLGWEPTVELEEGLPQVLAWVRCFDAQARPCLASV